ncbi:helix-turn-helix domain-containing protein [Paracoccus simplex]|uniref:Helix-turn-helix domain-containing protein n=1 Tax=Paracoccus simplex TaxID=2086346 RepID=A0ABV7RXB9_9RHOB
MRELIESPPTRKRLKEIFLDRYQRQQHPAEMLNCVAHMILAIDTSEEMVVVALEYISRRLGVCRGDLGFPTPRDPVYAPIIVHYNTGSDPQRCDGATYRNHSRVFRQAWAQPGPVACNDVASHPLLADCREEFTAIDSRSILFQRLSFAHRAVGMMCLDYTHDPHAWTDADKGFVREFTADFLGPLAGISHHWHGKTAAPSNGPARRPSLAELQAIRLAAQGLSCDEIGALLGKSARTVENQLRNARIGLQAANRAELIRKCEVWL